MELIMKLIISKRAGVRGNCQGKVFRTHVNALGFYEQPDLVLGTSYNPELAEQERKV